MPRGRAEPEALELGKDVPHPVRSLPAASNFRHRLFVVALLRLKETSQVVRVARVDRGWGCRHQMSRSQESILGSNGSSTTAGGPIARVRNRVFTLSQLSAIS